MHKLIITVAPTGSLTTKEQLTWNLITPREIIDELVREITTIEEVRHILHLK